ncbi:MAG: hypothetical protein JSU68_01610 [Phycisphaerales bacterium]|nr:MAG: hypothetical protein JSU68_01610 [Phycisphaerales bacterium]
MDAFLDNEPWDHCLTDGDKLEALLALVNRDAADKGRTVIAIYCDGQEVNAEQLTEALAKPLSKFQRVELSSLPASEVAAAVLNQAAALVQETERNQCDIVELLNEGNTVRGMELLAGSFRLWQQAHEAVLQAVRLGRVDLDDVQVEGTPSVDIISGLRDRLAQIKESLEARDYVMLADILQYEIGDTVQRWKSLIAELRARFSAHS